MKKFVFTLCKHENTIFHPTLAHPEKSLLDSEVPCICMSNNCSLILHYNLTDKKNGCARFERIKQAQGEDKIADEDCTLEEMKKGK